MIEESKNAQNRILPLEEIDLEKKTIFRQILRVQLQKYYPELNNKIGGIRSNIISVYPEFKEVFFNYHIFDKFLTIFVSHADNEIIMKFLPQIEILLSNVLSYAVEIPFEIEKVSLQQYSYLVQNVKQKDFKRKIQCVLEPVKFKLEKDQANKADLFFKVKLKSNYLNVIVEYKEEESFKKFYKKSTELIQRTYEACITPDKLDKKKEIQKPPKGIFNNSPSLYENQILKLKFPLSEDKYKMKVDDLKQVILYTKITNKKFEMVQIKEHIKYSKKKIEITFAHPSSYQVLQSFVAEVQPLIEQLLSEKINFSIKTSPQKKKMGIPKENLLVNQAFENSSIQNIEDLLNCNNFNQDQIIYVDENQILDYKDWKLPFSPNLIFILKKTICSFCNSNGGFILLGVAEKTIENKKAYQFVGTELHRNNTNDTTEYLTGLIAKKFYPDVHSDFQNFMRINYYELKSASKSKRSLYLIKIAVQRPKKYAGKVFMFNDGENQGFYSFIRANNTSRILDMHSLYDEIIKRNTDEKNNTLTNSTDPLVIKHFEKNPNIEVEILSSNEQRKNKENFCEERIQTIRNFPIQSGANANFLPNVKSFIIKKTPAKIENIENEKDFWMTLIKQFMEENTEFKGISSQIIADVENKTIQLIFSIINDDETLEKFIKAFQDVYK